MPRLSERHGGASRGRNGWRLILTAVSLFGILIITGCSGAEEQRKPDEPMVEEAALAEPISGKFSPPLGKALFIIGQDVSSINAYVEEVGTVPAGVTGYSSLQRQEGLTLEANYGSGPHHLDVLAEKYPNSVLELGLYLVDFLEPINDGRADQRIEDFLDHLESYDRPLFLRFGYEFDGAWNLYKPEEYVSAWRYFHEKLQSRGLDHVVMVWQSATHCDGTYGGETISAWYPGDQYVDWIGLSYFTQGECEYQPILEILDFAREHQKPVMIAESTPQRYDLRDLTFSLDGYDRQERTAEEIWQEWYQPFFDLIYSNRDVIQAITYINARWDDQRMWGKPYYSGYWGDSRVQANPEILQRWQAELDNDSWLQAGSGLFESISE